MEIQYYKEMLKSYEELNQGNILEHKNIFLFGHCNATEELAELLIGEGYSITAILDNNASKYGKEYKSIPIVSPDSILAENPSETIVCIVTRFYEAMHAQLRDLGFSGEIRKLVNYNTYAEYSLSDKTIKKKLKRVEQGKSVIEELEHKYPAHFRIFCPFSALGDIYFCMSYLPFFLKKHGRDRHIVCVVSDACAAVVSLFEECPVEVMQQTILDTAIQAALYMQDEDAFIAHQDRPYVVNLSKALYVKKISLEKIYCCGVFGLPQKTEPVVPVRWKEYRKLKSIKKGHAVILAPYAKSVTVLSDAVWEEIVSDYLERGWQVFTNVAGNEKPLRGTIPISPEICEMKSVVERAGTFIGIRSGMCDVVRTANCRKIALYPDYNYCDTKWKSIDIYRIKGFENIVVKDGFIWKNH